MFYMEGGGRGCQVEIARIFTGEAAGLPKYKFEHDIYYQLWPNK